MPYREGVGSNEAIRDYLRADETLLWSGVPPQGVVFRAADLFVIPFTLLWAGFAIFWTAEAVAEAPFPFWFFGLPFVAVGIYAVVGRFWVDARTRAATLYGVTDRRVLIVSGLFNMNVTSLALATLPPMVAKTNRWGGGTLEFGSTIRPFGGARIAGWPGAGWAAAPSFELTEGIDEVQRIILRAQKEAQRAD